AVVELDALADTVRPRAEDDDRAPRRGRFLVGLTPGRVEVVRLRSDLARHRVDAPIRRPHAPAAPPGPHDRFACLASAVNLAIRYSQSLQADPVVADEVVDRGNATQALGDAADLGPEPGMQTDG